ncbi:MAG: LamG-like jellyroll fold domain-containing protein, partial [Mobilitalea sp.]
MKMKKFFGAALTLSMVAMTVSSAFAATPKYEYSFDGDLGGAQVMTREGDNAEGGNIGTIPTADSTVEAQYAEGKNGQAISLDGTYGLLLDAENVGTSYSISFWINPARFSNYGPIIQIGSDLLSAKTSAKWLNITKTDWDGDSAPVIWSRNEVTGAWPWYCTAYFTCGGGYQIPKNEWSHIVVTVDGTKVGMDPVLGIEVPDTLMSQLYV